MRGVIDRLQHVNEVSLLTKTNAVIRKLKEEARLSMGDSAFDYLEGARMTLTGGIEFNPHTAAMCLLYMLPRIPMELIAGRTDNGATSIKPIHLVLTNNHDMFAAEENQGRLQTARSRRRWYIVVEEEGDNERIVYLHIRDEDEKGTDLTEVTSMLAVLRTLRKAEFNQVWQHVVGCSNFPELEGANKVFLSPDYFEAWKRTPFEVAWDFDPKRGSAVDRTVEIVTGLLKQTEPKEKKPFLLIGNDFSLRMTLFTLVLNGEQLGFLREFFRKELQMAGKYLRHLNITHQDSTADLKDFVEKYVLLTLLNKSYRRIPELKSTYEQIFSDENYKRLGYQRLLDGVRRSSARRSPLAEPVDYWDPRKLDANVLSDENPYVAKLFEQLSAINQPILSIPYLIGEMSAELAVKFIKEGLVDGERIGFVGKVGNIVNKDTRPLPRGQIVIPDMVFSSGSSISGLEYPAIFNITSGSGHFISASTQGSIVTVPAVLLQTFKDFTHCQSPTICADMEQYYLVKRLRESGFHTGIVPALYVSDNSVSSEARKNGYDGKTLETPLAPVEGSIAVCLATLFELDQLIQTANIR